jgi:hypothetical protein
MRLTLRIALVVFCAVLACSVVKADGLIGSTVTGELNEGTLSNPFLTILGSATAVVGASTPTFPAGTILGDSAFQIDITTDQIFYRPLQNVTYNNDPFKWVRIHVRGRADDFGSNAGRGQHVHSDGFQLHGELGDFEPERGYSDDG